jgi:fibronectin type 3 domain-containing protein
VSARPQSSPQTGTATIGTDAGTLTVSLSETPTAQQTAAHSVSLTWNAPAGADAVDSYQVERAAAGSTQYAIVGSTTAASTTYSDDSVQSGQTYHYEVRALDDQGNSSAPSNAISLAIP